MKEYRAITFFDLDGTLLNGQSQVDDEVAEAMKELKRNKVLPVIATGRSEVEIDGFKEQAGIDSSIVLNGQFIRVGAEVIHQDIFSDELCRDFYQFTLAQNHELAFYNAREIWVKRITEPMKKAYEYFHINLPEIKEQSELPVNMLLVLGEDDKDELYHQAFPDLTFYRNSPYSIDIVQKGASKGEGVKKLVSKLGLSGVPTFGFGDGLNDLALFEGCDTSIAMGNAVDEAKQAADYITTKNTDNGIINALKHFELI